MIDFNVTDCPLPDELHTPRSADCDALSRMSLPALLYHALVELAGDPYGLPV